MGRKIIAKLQISLDTRITSLSGGCAESKLWWGRRTVIVYVANPVIFFPTRILHVRAKRKCKHSTTTDNKSCRWAAHPRHNCASFHGVARQTRNDLFCHYKVITIRNHLHLQRDRIRVELWAVWGNYFTVVLSFHTMCDWWKHQGQKAGALMRRRAERQEGLLTIDIEHNRWQYHTRVIAALREYCNCSTTA